MKNLPWIVFAIAVLAQWAAPLSQIRQHEKILTTGTLIKLKCSAPDPYDPLRGRYLAVRPAESEFNVGADSKFTSEQPAYATFTTGADGLSSIKSLTAEPPLTDDYLLVKTSYVYGGKAHITWPFDRFYINEKLAPEADKWFAENIRSAKGIVAEVRVLKGRAVLTDLSLDGKPFREILKARVK